MIQWTSIIYSDPQGVSLATAGIKYKDFYKKRNTLVSDSDIFALQYKFHFKSVTKKKKSHL